MNHFRGQITDFAFQSLKQQNERFAETKHQTRTVIVVMVEILFPQQQSDTHMGEICYIVLISPERVK